MEFIDIPMAKPDIGEVEENAVMDVLKSGWLGQGKKTKEFEKRLSEYFSSNAVAVFNGSSAIMCALLAHGIKPGNNVAIPNFTFMSTASVPKILGANIIPIDIDPQTLNLDLVALETELKQNKIHFVIFVDVAGLANDIDQLIELSKKYDFILIEDAAEALGSEYKNKKLGSFEHTTIFSFHIAKVITTVEGGCVTTKDSDFAKKLMAIKDIGRTGKGYKHDYLGSNFRITDIQSTIGIQQIKKIDNIIDNKQKIASRYKNEIKVLDFQEIPKYATLHSYMLFFAIAQNEKLRDEYVKKLRNNGIDARLAWTPINQQPCFPELNQINLKNSDHISKKCFTIPIFNTISNEEITKVIDIINKNSV
jgi:perosamine synthetase